MMLLFDPLETVVTISQVLGVGLLLGAGVPAIFALGIRSLDSEKQGSTPVGISLLALCVILAISGVLLIVFGDTWFGI
ncbi:hypothetical protein [Humidisolicoccus flavus]|uniref:hypothetical protein n=1 Tax=Humidisolicoccus flavus TaxID=3111414 RepID=UPI00324BEA95